MDVQSARLASMKSTTYKLWSRRRPWQRCSRGPSPFLGTSQSRMAWIRIVS